MTLAAALAWTLLGTLPTHLVTGDTLTDYSRLRVYVHYQSPTWVAMHAAMVADTSVWNRYWPTVRTEAQWWWRVNAVAFPITLTDTTHGEWGVTVVRKSGAESAMSNQVAH